jgi:hypothetical protein
MFVPVLVTRPGSSGGFTSPIAPREVGHDHGVVLGPLRGRRWLALVRVHSEVTDRGLPNRADRQPSAKMTARAPERPTTQSGFFANMWTFPWGPRWIGLACSPVPVFEEETGQAVHILLTQSGWELATVVPGFALYRRPAVQD